MTVNLKNRLLGVSLLICVAVYILPSIAMAALSEAVWVEPSDGVNNIRLASFENDEWTVAETPLYTSENPLTSLALGTNSKGKKTLIWTEQIDVETILMSIVGELNGANEFEWSPPSLFSRYGKENFAASIVFDRNDDAWVFWSATYETYSDVMLRRSNGDVWGEPRRVNSANDVPDDQPRAQITAEGSIKVEWNSFDLESGASIARNKEFAPAAWVGVKAAPKLVDRIDQRDVPIPPQIPPYSAALLHFPLNAMIQSAPLNYLR